MVDVQRFSGIQGRLMTGLEVAGPPGGSVRVTGFQCVEAMV